MESEQKHFKEDFEKIDKEHEVWEHKMSHDAHDILREMCQEPERAHRPDCIKLMADISKEEHDERDAQMKHFTEEFEAIDKQHEAWEHEIDHEAHALLREMCQQPERRHRPDCVKILEQEAKSLDAQGTTAKKPLRAVETEHATWEHSFDDKAREVRREPC